MGNCLAFIRGFIRRVANCLYTRLQRRTVTTYFEQLESELNSFKTLASMKDEHGFLGQEVLRFYSIAGTLLNSSYKLDDKATVDERYSTHVLLRSLLENYFKIMYLFDNPSLTSTRYGLLQNGFKNQYLKLMNDLNTPQWQTFMQTHQAHLQPAQPTWKKLPELPDMNTMLTGLQNIYGDRLNYLYPIYRITSFDTHGQSLEAIFKSVFSIQCNFPVLQLKYAMELMANQYLCTLNEMRKIGVI